MKKTHPKYRGYLNELTWAIRYNFKRFRSIAKGKPKFIVVSVDEVYRSYAKSAKRWVVSAELGPDGRTKMVGGILKGKVRVCGHQRFNMPKGWLCSMPAGFRTDHLGIGRCYLHQGCMLVRESLIRRLAKSGKFPSLTDIEKEIDIKREDLRSVDSEIELLILFLMKSLKKETFTILDMDSAVRMIDSIAKLKKIAIGKDLQLAQMSLLDPGQVKEYIDWLMSVVEKEVEDPRVMSRIAMAISKEAPRKLADIRQKRGFMLPPMEEVKPDSKEVGESEIVVTNGKSEG